MPSEQAQWRRMTHDEEMACLAIAPGRVSYPVASSPKRLARNLSAQAMCDPPQITDKQAVAMWSLVHRFRRQLPKNVVRMAEEARST